jgi:membrane-associated phospholipid phosphatase
MHLVLAALLAASTAPADSRALPYEPVRDLTITGVAGLGWLLSQVFDKQLAPESCRWCDPPGFDSSVRDSLKWSDTGAANTASNILAYGGMPIATLGVDLLASGGDWRVAGTDALIAAESALVAGAFDQGIKHLVGRERPFVHALDPSQKPLTDKPADNNVSFYSGHTSFTTAIAVSAGMCASLRGERNAWMVWATGVPLALGTGYLRIAADKHYASDVLVGAAMGGLFGAAIPYFLHRPQQDAGASASLAVGPRMLALSGRF